MTLQLFVDCKSIIPDITIAILTLNVADGTLIVSFIRNLDRHQKCLLLLGRLDLPFEAIVVTTIIKFISSAVAKIYKLRTARLRELEAPWLSRTARLRELEAPWLSR